MSRVYLNCCTSWPPEDVNSEGGLCDMVADSIEITRDTFLKQVDRDSLRNVEESLGYPSRPSKDYPLTMAADRCVTYHRSKLHGERVYYFKHSAIEYVFATVGK